MDDSIVEEYAEALYMAARDTHQAAADMDPLRGTRPNPRGGAPVAAPVDIQSWQRLSPPIRSLWLARARRELESL